MELDTERPREQYYIPVIPRGVILPQGSSPKERRATQEAKTTDDLQGVQVIRPKDGKGLTFQRHFSTEGTHPFDQVEWETRDAVIPNFKEGGNAFEQRGVEFPKHWSQNATNIVAQKYFRG